MKRLRTLYFDIESSDLAADIGRIFCISWAFNEGPVRHLVAWRPDQERYILETFEDIWRQADIAVAHFGVRFDQAFIQTRRLVLGFKPLSVPTFVDTWWIAKHKLRFRGNSLERIADALHCPLKKIPVSINEWAAARWNDKDAITQIIQHCDQDVKILRFAAKKLAPYWENYPKTFWVEPVKVMVESYGQCGCGGDYQSAGLRPTAKFVYRRLRCKQCGRSAKGKVVK